MNQDRRDAQAWAQEWAIRQRNKKIIVAVACVVGAVVLGFLANYISMIATRSTYGSEEEMRAALQGRFAYSNYEDIEINGDDVTLTYYETSHYDSDYAKEYGYSEYDDSVYEDYVKEWDYKHGVIKMNWMSDITVDKKGRLVYYSQEFRKTDEPKPVPFDPAILNETSGSLTEAEEDALDETDEAVDEQQDSLEQTQEQAELAGMASGARSNETENSEDGDN